MRYPADMHVHSTFSCDATYTMEEHVKDAISNGYRAVCFTEHVDYHPLDEGRGFYNYDAVSQEIHRLKEIYGHQILILKGIEFGEPHQYPREFEAYTKRDYDYILASVHWMGDYFVLDKRLIQEFTPEAIFEKYYRELEAMVRFGGFDAVAHMDYLRRGTGLDLYSEEQLKAIFSLMVKNDIALEINSQNLRRGIEHSFPSPDKVSLYAQAGGKKVVLGSDGHHAGNLGSGIEQALDACKHIQGLTYGIFMGRKFTAL